MWYTIETMDDWLSRLAIRFMGDVNAWTEIYEANKQVIGPDANKIRIGMTLWIPVDGAAKPAETSSNNTMAYGPGNYSSNVVGTPSTFNQPTTGVQTSSQGIIDIVPNPKNKMMIYGGAALAGLAMLMMLGKKKKLA